MYVPRRIESSPDWIDPDGTKIYTVSFSGRPVDRAPYRQRLADVKRSKGLAWPSIPSFAIFHEGATHQYMVLAWWGNENELLTSVSVRGENEATWIVDPDRFSFCLWDLEIIWAERNLFVETLYSGRPDLEAYRRGRLRPTDTASDDPRSERRPGELSPLAPAEAAPEATVCRRCGRAITKDVELAEVREGMHGICFHLEYEHDADPDAPCGDPSCPWAERLALEAKLREVGIDPRRVLDEAIERSWS